MLNTESFLNDIRKKYHNFADNSFYIIIGVDSTGTPSILRDFEGDILKYPDYELAESTVFVLNKTNLAKYYIEGVE